MRINLLLMICAFSVAVGCAGMNPGGSDSVVPDVARVGAGIHSGSAATFDARHHFVVNVPRGAKDVDIWFARPNPRDAMQKIEDWRVDFAHPVREVTDNWGNRFIHMQLDDPEPGSFVVDTTFELTRKEVNADIDPANTRPHDAVELARLARYLQGSRQSVIDENARAMARKAVGAERNPILASRKIYDAILNHVEYHVKDPFSDSAKAMNSTGKGSSELCYTSGTGNCTDFHSLYAAVSRAAGIPTRAVYGSFFKGPLDGVDKDQSYHCWIEFHAPNIGWIPLDVAVADIFVEDFRANENSKPRANLTVANGYEGPNPELVDYYFGNIDNRRVTWHWGRDLVMLPPQKGDPLLWNPKAYAEVDGKPASIVTRKLTYKEVK